MWGGTRTRRIVCACVCAMCVVVCCVCVHVCVHTCGCIIPKLMIIEGDNRPTAELVKLVANLR